MIPTETTEYNLTNHKPTDDGIERIERLREGAKDYARLIHGLCPDGREKALAITKLEETTFWANAAVARVETDDAQQR